VHFPIAPFVPVNIIVVVNDEAFAIGFFLLTQEEIELIYAVDDPVSPLLPESCRANEQGTARAMTLCLPRLTHSAGRGAL
jgi:hypothetical protein